MNAPGGQLRAGEIGPEVLVEPREVARRGGVSSVSWLLVFIPFVVVFLLIGRYLIAGVVLVVTLLWAVKDRKSKRLPLAPLAVFSVAGGLLIFFIILPILNLLFTTEPARVVTTALDPAVQSALVITLSAALDRHSHLAPVRHSSRVRSRTGAVYRKVRCGGDRRHAGGDSAHHRRYFAAFYFWRAAAFSALL